MTMLKGWVDNRLDSPVEFDVSDLANEYLESGVDEAYMGWPLDRKLRMWLSTGKWGSEGREFQGKSIVWEDEAAYDKFVDLVIDRRRERENAAE